MKYVFNIVISQLNTFDSEETQLTLQVTTFVVFELELLKEALLDLPHLVFVAAGRHQATLLSGTIGEDLYLDDLVLVLITLILLVEEVVHLVVMYGRG